MILQRSEYSFKKLLSLEKSFFGARDSYFSAIERTLGTSYVEGYDATPWLDFFCYVLRENTLDLVGKLTDWHRSMQKVYAMFENLELNRRQADGFAYAVQAENITRMDYMEVTGASAQTASRDLAKLVELGLLEPEGKTRARVYTPILPTE